MTDLTPRANHAVKEADVVVGYDTYLALIAELIGDKAVVGTGMMQEIDRCQASVDLAAPG